ncbi:hypothetical protein FRC09_014000 [Ceratobasidium sp. 395]|nr:hypothetical protein FRC09_014000 [Ceratobasidium sp. 395]
MPPQPVVNPPVEPAPSSTKPPGINLLNANQNVTILTRITQKLSENIPRLQNTFSSQDEVLTLYKLLRHDALSFVNYLDALFVKLPGSDHPCIKYCPGNDKTPKPATTTLPPVKFVDHKSISTEPVTITPAPTLDCDDMAIDPPTPTPRSYASVAVGTPTHPDPKPADPTPSRPTSFSVPHKSRPLGQAQSIVAKNPVRLVVRPTNTKYMQKPFAMLLVNGPSNPYRLLSHALSLSPTTKDITVMT